MSDSPINCSKCGAALNERIETVWMKVQGWEHKRQGGGLNHVALREILGEYMCNGCMTKLRHGIALEQGTLL